MLLKTFVIFGLSLKWNWTWGIYFVDKSLQLSEWANDWSTLTKRKWTTKGANLIHKTHDSVWWVYDSVRVPSSCRRHILPINILFSQIWMFFGQARQEKTAISTAKPVYISSSLIISCKLTGGRRSRKKITYNTSTRSPETKLPQEN